MNARELRVKLNEKINEGRAMIEAAEKENRDFNPEEQTKYDGIKTEITSLQNRIQRAEELPESLQNGNHPNVLKIKTGDSEARAFAHFLRTGDGGGLKSESVEGGFDEERGRNEYEIRVPKGSELRSTTDVMAVSDSTGGGAAVPTGFSGRVAARRNELRLAEKLGVQNVPGVGTTVSFPYENGDPNVFAATSEQLDALSNTYEADRPVLATKSFTLAKKTKKIPLTEELLDDEDVTLMNFVADHVGRAQAMTHNYLLLTEVAANGTSLKSFASASAIAAGEPEAMVYHDTLGFYLDDGNAAAWVTRPATFGKIKNITGSSRLYDDQAPGSRYKSLLEYPVFYSSYATAIAASAKSIYFGNWFYMGMREAPAMRFIRDPYSMDGIIYLKYSFRTCYGVLIAGAVGYGLHPTG